MPVRQQTAQPPVYWSGKVTTESSSRSVLDALWSISLAVLPFMFIIGWRICADFFDEDSRFLNSSLLAVVGAGSLAVFARKPVRRILPIVVLLGIFTVGYFLKGYWIVFNLNEGRVFDNTSLIEPMIVPLLYRENLLRAFELSTYGFVAYCLGCIVILRLDPVDDVDWTKPRAGNTRSISTWCLISALVLTSITTVIVYVFGIGVHGMEAQALPFKMTAAFRYVRTVLIYFLFIIALAYSDRRESRFLWGCSLVGLSLYALSIVVAEASRGEFVSKLALPLMILWIARNRLTWRRVLVIMIVFVAAVLMRPFLASYRTVRVHFDLGLADSVITAFRLYQLDDTVGGLASITSLTDSFLAVAFRMIGFDGVVFCTGIENVQLDLSRIADVLLWRESFTQRFTQEVVGYGANVTTHYNSPSLVGGLYWLGGVPLIVIGTACFTAIMQKAWAWANRAKHIVSPALLVAIIGLVLTIGNEGSFDSLVREGIAIVFFLSALEYILKRSTSVTVR